MKMKRKEGLLTMRLSAEEKKQMTAEADKRGLTLSSYARMILYARHEKDLKAAK